MTYKVFGGTLSLTQSIIELTISLLCVMYSTSRVLHLLATWMAEIYVLGVIKRMQFLASMC